MPATATATPTHHLAQLNIARLLAPLDSPQLAGFVAALAGVNAAADAAPGFVWRMIDEPGDTRAAQLFGEGVVTNLSTWVDVPALQAFAFRSNHAEVLRQRRQWFAPMDQAYLALWWVPAGHRPSLEEAAERLTHLRTHGPGERVFGFGQVYTPAGQPVVRTPPAG